MKAFSGCVKATLQLILSSCTQGSISDKNRVNIQVSRCSKFRGKLGKIYNKFNFKIHGIINCRNKSMV